MLKASRTFCARQADRVIVPSRYLARWIANWGVPEERIVVIYNALEPLNGIEPANIPLQTPVKVVTVGRLVPWKHVDKVMDAVARLDGISLVIIGDGPERGHLEAFASTLGIGDRIYFAGVRNKAETLALMAACDVFVLNSTYEGFPHVVLEAMALGLPVVATAVGGTPEVIKSGLNGLLIEANGGTLKHVLGKLIVNGNLRKQLSINARETVQEAFSVNAMIAQTEAELAGAAGRSR